MTLLTIVQDASTALGLSSPSTVVSNTSQTQMLSLAILEGKDLASRAPWKSLRRTNTWTLSTSSSSQGAMNSTIVTAGDFDYIIQDTFYNTTTALPIDGPVSAEDEEVMNAVGFSGPYQQFSIRSDGGLYIFPQPTSADSTRFQYKSTFWCKSSGGTKKAAWTVDTDIGVLSESLMTLGLIWRWKRANGLDYAQEFDIYERRVHEAIAQESSGARTLDMGGGKGASYGIVVPIGGYG